MASRGHCGVVEMEGGPQWLEEGTAMKEDLESSQPHCRPQQGDGESPFGSYF